MKEELPKGWKWVIIKDVADINPKIPNRELILNDLEVQFLPMKAVEEANGKFHLTSTKKYIEVKKGYTPFINNDIIFAKVTPCMENGKIAVVNSLRNGIGFGSSEFHVIRTMENLDSKYIFYFLIQEKYRNEAQNAMTGAVGLRRVPKKFLEESKIPLPPKFTQQAIVSKIEELFSEIDKGIENLLTAQQQLKTYRQSVLKCAFEGKLTNEWRTQQNNLCTPTELLEKLKKEKEDKEITSGSKSKQVPPLSAEELKDLSKLPNNWRWLRLGEILWSVKDGPHYSPKYEKQGVPFISGGNIRPNGINFSNAKFISEELHKEFSKRCKPELNDVLYSKGGTTGIARVNTYNFDFNVWVHVAVLKPLNSIYPFYLQYALNSNHCYKQSQNYTHGVGNQDLGLTRMVLISLPICSTNEQKQVVLEIESRLSIADKMEETITQSLQQAEALRQSILKRAFEGKLV